MPALQRRQPPADLRKAAGNLSNQVAAYPMVKSDSQTSEDDMELQTPKQLQIRSAARMPLRYESDEESTSPCPDDFEDARSSFSDVEFDSALDLDDDEVPSIVEAVGVHMSTAKPMVVNIARFAPMDKRSTAAHKRPHFIHASTLPTKTSIARPGVGRVVGDGPSVVTLSKPPSRGNKGPPPVPARNEARASPPPPVASTQRPTFPPRKDSHVSRPSVSTIASSNFDDDRSSIADSSASSAPSSVADDADIAARNKFLTERDESRKDSLTMAQDAELELAIAEYMRWRSEGSPKDAAHPGQLSPSHFLHGRRFAVDGGQMGSKMGKMGAREEEDEAWRRELEEGLATPTPTTYAAYDPYGCAPPTLSKAGPMPMPADRRHSASKQGGSIAGFRRGLGMSRRD